METAPSREGRHVLTLIAKTMVNMANGIPFGDCVPWPAAATDSVLGTKEPAMKEMNEFILHNLNRVSDFFDELAVIINLCDRGWQ